MQRLYFGTHRLVVGLREPADNEPYQLGGNATALVEVLDVRWYIHATSPDCGRPPSGRASDATGARNEGHRKIRT